MKKILSIFSLVVIAGLIGYSLYWVFKPSATVPHDFGSTSTTTPTTILSYEEKSIVEDNAEYKYAVNIEYPFLTGGDTSVISSINKSIELQMKNELGWFKKNAIDTYTDLPPILLENAEQSFLEVKYEFSEELMKKEILSIHFPELFYSLGAAHPGHSSVTMTFDLSTGDTIDLNDLFIGDYLHYISNLTIEKLRVQLSGISTEETIQVGASAKAENYDKYYFAEDGMHILFEDYQVAPYAAGPQEVILSYDELQTIIDTKGILANLVK